MGAWATVTTARQLLFSISFELGKQLGSRALVDAVPEVCKLREGGGGSSRQPRLEAPFELSLASLLQGWSSGAGGSSGSSILHSSIQRVTQSSVRRQLKTVKSRPASLAQPATVLQQVDDCRPLQPDKAPSLAPSELNRGVGPSGSGANPAV